MRNIIDLYTSKSMEYLNNDEIIKKYEKELKEKQEFVKDLVINTRLIDKIIHPFCLIRTSSELKRLDRIKKEYYELKNSNLLEHIDEETGDLQEDLSGAATYYKPKRIRNYAKENPIYNLEDDNKLLKKRK